MKTRFLTLIAMIAALWLYAGCSNGNVSVREESLLENNWGRSFESAKYNQILNPDAGKKEEPVEEIDGQAAQQTVEQYRKSFGKSPGPNTYNVNIGAITSGKQAQ
jgi:hypothetical protein